MILFESYVLVSKHQIIWVWRYSCSLIKSSLNFYHFPIRVKYLWFHLCLIGSILQSYPPFFLLINDDHLLNNWKEWKIQEYKTENFFTTFLFIPVEYLALYIKLFLDNIVRGQYIIYLSFHILQRVNIFLLLEHKRFFCYSFFSFFTQIL